MSKKQDERKLRLRRESLRTLDGLADQELRRVAGGWGDESDWPTGVMLSRCCRNG